MPTTMGMNTSADPAEAAVVEIAASDEVSDELLSVLTKFVTQPSSDLGLIQVSARTGLTLATAASALTKLEQLGAIVAVRSDHNRRRYRLRAPSSRPVGKHAS
jgi:DNA-binding MarR family transcriptional regulator